MESAPEVSVGLEKFLQVNWPNGEQIPSSPHSVTGLKGLNVAAALFALRQNRGLRNRSDGNGRVGNVSSHFPMVATEPIEWTLPTFDQSQFSTRTVTPLPTSAVATVKPVNVFTPTPVTQPKVSSVTQLQHPNPSPPATKVVTATLYQKQQQRLQQQRYAAKNQQQSQHLQQNHNSNNNNNNNNNNAGGTTEYGEFYLLPPGSASKPTTP